MPKPKSTSSSGRQRRNNNNSNKEKKKSVPKHKLPASMIKRGNKREVVFDPEARRAHLRGFSERKRQRRAFGLAMQKVKDRKAKIEQRAAVKKEGLERLEEAERQKEEVMEEVFRMNNATVASFGENDSDSDDENDNDNGNQKSEKSKGRNKNSNKNKNDDSYSENQKQQVIKGEKQPISDVLDTKIYDDRTSEKHWGGQVTVTTSVVDFGDLSNGDSDNGEDDESMDDSIHKSNKKSVDKAQKYAGNVQRYMEKLKGNMPAKKNRDGSMTKRKGRDGASEMKGVGGSGNLKIASKLLSRSKDKRSAGTSGGSKKGKRRK